MADEKEEAPDSPDVYFEPLVNLPPVETLTCEENEDELIKLRAKLFRYDPTADPGEWKERGVGDVKILRNKDEDTCRVVMRRDKTLKLCANHFVLPHMELKPNCGSDRAWVWNTPADFADEKSKSELLAIRFANAENAQKFKDKFEFAKNIMKERSPEKKRKSEDDTDKQNGLESSPTDKDADDVASKLEELAVTDDTKIDKNTEETEKKSSQTQPTDGSSTESEDKDQAER